MSLAKSTLLVMASRVFVLFAGLIVSLVAARSLSRVEQGYFFTFLSLAAAQSLFELGITNLILHHLSHARSAILTAMNAGEKQKALDIAESTRNYSIRYFSRAAGLFIVFVGLGGAVFFTWSRSAEGVHWHSPWALIVVGTALSLFNLTYFSHLEAFGRLNVSYRVRIASTAILIAGFCISAYYRGGLLSYPIALLISNGYAFYALRHECTKVNQAHGLTGTFSSQRIDIGREQRKMAASSVAGYVTVNSFTPYAFHFFSAEVAGQVGLTISIFGAIATVAMARTTAEAPSYGPLIAAGDLTTLKNRSRNTLLFSSMLALLLGIISTAMRLLSHALFPEYIDRVLDTVGFLVIGFLIVSNVILSATSTALRAFKTEQLMWPSLAAAFIVLVAQLVLRLEPVHCLAILAAFNGLVFYPYAQRRLTAQLSSRHE